ncbi:MAG: hypothetical protein C0412_02550 [Flavobacterium sp.]|nr:hypothetical protein [Flavobacterium sp.]
MNLCEAVVMKNWKPLSSIMVSIVCLAYNHELFIGEAMESFLKQETDFPFEILVGEDCSTDNTKEIVLDYIKKYPRIIRIISSPKNVGMQENCWRTLNSANGKYIAFCEGDDFWVYNKKLQMQVDFLEANPEYSITAHAVKILDNTSRGVTYNPYSDFAGGKFDTSDILLKHFLPTLSLVFKKSALVIPDWFLLCRSLDILMELILSLSGSGMFFNQVMGTYRHHDGGITKVQTDRSEIYKNSCFLFSQFNIYSERKFEKEVNQRISFLNWGMVAINYKKNDFLGVASFFLKAIRSSPFFFLTKIFLPVFRNRFFRRT